jgi:hypothetical protein
MSATDELETRITGVADAIERTEEHLQGLRWGSLEEAERAHLEQVSMLTRGLTLDEQELLADVLLQRQVAALEARVEELEQRTASFNPDTGDGPPMRWAGVWDGDVEYRHGATVVRRDTLWCAESTNRGVEPGREDGEPRAWRMVMKAPPDRRPAARERK